MFYVLFKFPCFIHPFKIEGYDGNDNTVLNSIKLNCQSTDRNTLGGYVTSGEGAFGDWQGQQVCGALEYMTSFALKVQPDGVIEINQLLRLFLVHILTPFELDMVLENLEVSLYLFSTLINL